MSDGPVYDYFATQFATAITKESGASTQYWFGRMIRFLGSDEWVFKNFFGDDYTEADFREKFEQGDITIDTFDISNVHYTINPTDSTLATVTMDVYIEATVDGKQQSGNFTLSHKAKLGWQAYQSQLS